MARLVLTVVAALITAAPTRCMNLCDVRKSISIHSPTCADDGTCPHGNLESNVGATLIAGRSVEADFRIDSCSASSDTMVTPVYSASKLVTAILMMKLVDEGLLSLDEPLSGYFGWWTSSADDHRSRVALRHALSMVAGFGYVPCADDKSGSVTNAECARKIHDAYGTFPNGGLNPIPTSVALPDPSSVSPGVFFLYEETSWNLVVALALQVTGADEFQDVFEEYLAIPLGIDPEDCNYDSLQPKNVDGGADLSCKARDYAKILGAYYAGNILSDTSMNEIESTQTTNITSIVSNYSDSIEYGLGNWEASGTRQSFGAFGVLPWIDRETGYWALLFRDAVYGGFDSADAVYGGSNGILSMMRELYQTETFLAESGNCDLDCSNAVSPPLDLGPCEEAAPCFGDLGCSAFDPMKQSWSGSFESCNSIALFLGNVICAPYFPDSPCFRQDGAVDSNPVRW